MLRSSTTLGPSATLLELLSDAGETRSRFVADETSKVSLGSLVAGAGLGARLGELRGRSVLLAVDTQLACAAALVALDGVARRILLAPPDLAPAHLPFVLAAGEVDAVIADRALPEYGEVPVIRPDPAASPQPCRDGARPTEWVLFTSGTMGQPKMVVHSLRSLSGHLPSGPSAGRAPVWCTFYDIRRYGGLQILLRALLGGGSMVLSGAHETPGAFLARAGTLGVTHVLGTPSHWRRAVMSGEAGRIAPGYVRLSGEVADQAILDRLKLAYPDARVAHAFASTEAGVGFEVNDGLAGFPAGLIGQDGAVELRVVDGSLRVRSTRIAARYLGGIDGPSGEDGFVDTGDLVERQDERFYFAGRREGIVNIGGQKVYPEEVEAVINRHPGVEMSLVKGRKSPITGAVLLADVLARPRPETGDAADDVLIGEILDLCRGELPRHKVPASIRLVASLDIAASGKLVRPRA